MPFGHEKYIKPDDVLSPVPKGPGWGMQLAQPDLLTRSRSRSYLLDELLFMQQVQPGDAVLLFQDQCKVLCASDRQLLLHREDDVLPGTVRYKGHQKSSLALMLRHRVGRASLTFCLLLSAAGERKACAHWVHCQLRQQILDEIFRLPFHNSFNLFNSLVEIIVNFVMILMLNVILEKFKLP